MTYQALARKYRPQSFRDIIGQETVVRTLLNAIEPHRIHHAYLSSDLRGVALLAAASRPALRGCPSVTALLFPRLQR